MAFGEDPYFVEVADLEGDGHLDILATAPFTNGIYILAGRGTLGLKAPSKLDMVEPPLLAAVLDLDADDDLDLAVTQGSEGSVALLRNDRSGFSPVGTLPMHGNPFGVDGADLDADGDLDLAAGDNFSVSVWWSDGQGGLGNRTELNQGHRHELVYLRDVDLDGDADLLAQSGGVWIIQNDGAGTFRPPLRIGPAVDLVGWTAEDLDADGDVDIAGVVGNGLLIFLDSGRGSFQPTPMTGFAHAYRIAAADLDGDSDRELILGDLDSPRLTVVDNRSEPPRSVDADLNGIPDECDTRFERCNVNGDTKKDIADGIWILNRLFRGGPELRCSKAGDCDEDGLIDASDAIFIFQYQLRGGSRPPEPFAHCGGDPTADALDCLEYASPCTPGGRLPDGF